MIPTGPNANPQDDGDDFVEISLLLRGNAAEFIILRGQLPRLEETLTAILTIPPDQPKMVKLETTVGIITFFSNYFTGWIVRDDPVMVKDDKTP